MELLVFLAVVIGVFIYVFREHPARLRRPSIAEEMITNNQTIEQTLKKYLGEKTAEPTPIEQPIAQIPQTAAEPTPETRKPSAKPKQIAPKAPQPAFNVRDFVVYNVIWNKKY
jgi:hypothetical protein